MDALAALSLAGNVLQFVQFTSGILRSTRKIYNSAAGVSDECEQLDNVYSKLSEFSVQLGNRITLDSVKIDDSDIVECANMCKKDCDALLVITDKLRIKDSIKRRWWHSFAIAIQEVWKSSEIDSLRACIEQHRNFMVLKLCTVSW